MIVLSRTRRIDWPAVITDLRRHVTLADIAAEVGVVPGAVKSYCDDRCIEPAFWTGSALLVMWAAKEGRSYTEAPVRNVQPTVAAVLGWGGPRNRQDIDAALRHDSCATVDKPA